MISKRIHKDLSALQLKKYRVESQLFIVEGEKMVGELLQSNWSIQLLIGTAEWIETHSDQIQKDYELIEALPDELKKLSSLKSPNKVLAVVKMPGAKIELAELENKLAMVIEDVQDPGNLGTILRLCDWFGIKHLICSNSTVDIYNPKVVQASMGSIFRIKIEYNELGYWLKEYTKKISQPVYGAFLDGVNIYEEPLSANGLIVLGNESKGISKEIEMQISKKLCIPSYEGSGAESLNVSIAAAIICSEFRRRT